MTLMNKNIQPNDLVKLFEQSEPCLFNNSVTNLMPVKYENMSAQEIDLLVKGNE